MLDPRAAMRLANRRCCAHAARAAKALLSHAACASTSPRARGSGALRLADRGRESRARSRAALRAPAPEFPPGCAVSEIEQFRAAGAPAVADAAAGRSIPEEGCAVQGGGTAVRDPRPIRLKPEDVEGTRAGAGRNGAAAPRARVSRDVGCQACRCSGHSEAELLPSRSKVAPQRVSSASCCSSRPVLRRLARSASAGRRAERIEAPAPRRRHRASRGGAGARWRRSRRGRRTSLRGRITTGASAGRRPQRGGGVGACASSLRQGGTVA